MVKNKRINSNKVRLNYLKECLSYDPETGDLTWKCRPEYHFKPRRANQWNARYSNKTAGSMDKKSGYLQIRIDGKKHQAHRICYFIYHGYMPENGIDHKDRIRHHNWIDNLREATNQCNIRNAKVSSNNISGIKGVSLNKRKKWDSYIMINRKKIFLGGHKNFDQAVKARWKAEVKHKFPNCNTSSSAHNYLCDNNLL